MHNVKYQGHTIWQQAAHTTYLLLSPSYSMRATEMSENFVEKSFAKKWQDGKSLNSRTGHGLTLNMYVYRTM